MGWEALRELAVCFVYEYRFLDIDGGKIKSCVFKVELIVIARKERTAVKSELSVTLQVTLS